MTNREYTAMLHYQGQVALASREFVNTLTMPPTEVMHIVELDDSIRLAYVNACRHMNAALSEIRNLQTAVNARKPQ